MGHPRTGGVGGGTEERLDQTELGFASPPLDNLSSKTPPRASVALLSWAVRFLTWYGVQGGLSGRGDLWAGI